MWMPRVERGTAARLEGEGALGHDRIRGTVRRTYAAIGPGARCHGSRVESSDAVHRGVDGDPDVSVRWLSPEGASGPLPCLIILSNGGAYVRGTGATTTTGSI